MNSVVMHTMPPAPAPLAVASGEKRAIVEWYLRRSIVTTVAPGCKKAFEENPEEYIG